MTNIRSAFFAWVNDRGCDTDGAWSAYQAAFIAGMEEAAKIAEKRCVPDGVMDCAPLINAAAAIRAAASRKPA